MDIVGYSNTRKFVLRKTILLIIWEVGRELWKIMESFYGVLISQSKHDKFSFSSLLISS
jgi:hypothetical protein